MSAVLYRFRRELRRRWRGWTALGLVIGVIAGAVLSLAAGADRTQSAFRRYLDQTSAADLYMVSSVGDAEFDMAEVDLAGLAALPAVEEAALYRTALASGTVTDRDIEISGDLFGFLLPDDDALGSTVTGFKVTDGRAPDPSRPDEAAIDTIVAEETGIEVGDELRVHFARFDEAQQVFGEAEAEADSGLDSLNRSEPLNTVQVVGVVATPSSFVNQDDTEDFPSIYFTAALSEELDDVLGFPTAAFRTTDTRGTSEVLAAAEEQAGGVPVVSQLQRTQTPQVQRNFDVLSRALRLAALLGALVALVAIGQALGRQARAEAVDDVTLAAIGFDTSSLGLLRLAKAAFVAVLAAPVVVVTAVALSPFFPIGPARTAEPDPGVQFSTLFLVGAAATATAVLAMVAISSWRASRGGRAAGRASRAGVRPGPLAKVLTVLGNSPPARAGAHFAFQRSGRADRAPLRSSGGLIALGLLALVATIGFSAGIRHLQETPRLYGWAWDLTFGGDFTENLGEEGTALLAADDDTQALAAGNDLPVDIEGERVIMFGGDEQVGELPLSLTEGRTPANGDEIVLAADELREVSVGETVAVSIEGASGDYTVVGRAALPRIEAFTTFDGVHRLEPELGIQEVYVALRPDADPEAYIDRMLGPLGLTRIDVRRPEPPATVQNVEEIEAVPIILAGLLALIGVLSIVHLLITSRTARRRDQAVLKTFGFTPSQSGRIVLWQATLVVLAALVIALPLGVMLGRAAWFAFADGIGVVARPVVPIAVAAVPIIALVGTLLLALPFARSAARTPPVTALREE